MNDLNDHHGGFGGDVWWHLLIMILVIALIGLAVWFILSRLHGATPRGGSPATEDSAIATLRDRLARSEISEEEYRSRLALLEGADTTS